MKIVFLLDNAYGIGGTIRSTVNLSRALVDRHEVEVVSLRQGRDEPGLPFDPRVKLTSLIDTRPGSPAYDGDDPRFHRPSERFTEGADHLSRGIATRLGDERMEAFLSDLDADVVIGTRPKINDYLAAYGTDRYLRIGQEHLTHRIHSEHVRRHQDAAIPHLDAFVTVSYADAASYRTALPGSPAQIVCIPNAVPSTGVEPSDGQSKLIVAAGRLIKVKRYDRLLRAFALVSEQHPDWRLRIYGRGKQHGALRKTINELGLYDRAFLMGARSPIDTEWAKGSVAAVSSDSESFGMTLVEAMNCGVPVVSTDCRYGPGEIIANGKDGLLSPLDSDEDFNVRAYADALLQLIENPDLRLRMGEAARRKGARYAPERIAGEYEQLIAELREPRAERASGQGSAADGAADGGSAEGASDPSGALRRRAPVPTAAPPLTPPAPEPASAPAGTSGTDKGSGSPGKGSPGKGSADTDSTGKGSTGKGSAGGDGTGKARPGSAPARSRSGRSSPVRRMRRLAGRLLRRVLRTLRGGTGTVGARHTRTGAGGAPGSHEGSGGTSMARPLARVRVCPDGSLAVRLRADRLPKGGAYLVLRARAQDGTSPVRLPLPPPAEADAEGWVEVLVGRAGRVLAEARWDASLERASDGKRKRVRPELVETARLLTLPAPFAPDGALNPWVPYTTSDGYLAVRAWHRSGHAEVDSVRLRQRAFTVRASLYGRAADVSYAAMSAGPSASTSADALDEPALVALSRGDARETFEIPGKRSPGTSGPDGGPAGPPTAVFELPYELATAFAEGAPEATWDLYLRPGQGRRPVRLARLLGDLADRKKTDVSPTARLADTGTGERLYFSVNNNLALALSPLPANAEAETDTVAEGEKGRAEKAAGQKSLSSSPSASASS